MGSGRGTTAARNSQQQPENKWGAERGNGSTRGSSAREYEAEAPVDTRGGGVEALADRRQWCDKRQHNNQPENKRDVVIGSVVMRGGGHQRLGLWACCWCRTIGIRRWILLLKWKGAQASETGPDADVSNDV